MTILIRRETRLDYPAVEEINRAAFPSPGEAELVNRLRKTCPTAVSLVAEQEGQVCGHIFFSPVTIENPNAPLGMGLGPMAVLPAMQRQGIGSALVQAGLEALRETGCPYVIVLGHPHFYPRFGFVPASRYGLHCKWEGIPDEVFMVQELQPGCLAGCTGLVQYRPEFDQVT